MTDIQSRKADHLKICLEQDVQCDQITNGLEAYRFNHCCLPELDRDQVSLSSSFLGKPLGAPLLISSMTGGTDLAWQLNQRLAAAAQKYGLAMGVGSQRVALEQAPLAATFAVRRLAPDIPLFANLGAVQLNYGYGLAECCQVVEQLEADALILHLNPLQECVQTRGDRNFRGLLDKIAALCQHLPVPVIIKEVGNGISAAVAVELVAAGVAAVDVAGAGGTSWSRVESERATDPLQRRLGHTFANWGLPTAECVLQVRQALPQLPLIASGGLRDGLEVAKVLALGADLAGLASPLLRAAQESEAHLYNLLEALLAELATVMFCTGSATLAQLRRPHVLVSSPPSPRALTRSGEISYATSQDSSAL